MEKINYSDLNLKEMKKLDTRLFSYNELYIKDEIVYKIFRDMPEYEAKKIENKIESIKKLDKDYIINAEEKIMDGEILKGYTSKYVESETLHSLLKKKDMLSEIKTLLEVSKYLEDLHNSNGTPYIGDFHFNNVLIDNNSNIKFVDNDSFSINGIESNGVPTCLCNYFDFKNKKIEKNQNTDRIAFMLAIFNRLADRDIFTISHFAYEDYTGRYPFLNQLYPIYFDLKQKRGSIPEVPYLHKVLKNYDNS